MNNVNIQDEDEEENEEQIEQRRIIDEQDKIESDFRQLKGDVDHEKLTEEQINALKAYLLDIEVIGVYGDDNTPLDKFDSQCH